jgi:hypothetical protein
MPKIPKMPYMLKEIAVALATCQSVPKRVAIDGMPSGKAISTRIQICRWRQAFLNHFVDMERPSHFRHSDADHYLSSEMAKGFTCEMLELISFHIVPPPNISATYRSLEAVVYPRPIAYVVNPDGSRSLPDYSRVNERPRHDQIMEGGAATPRTSLDDFSNTSFLVANQPPRVPQVNPLTDFCISEEKALALAVTDAKLANLAKLSNLAMQEQMRELHEAQEAENAERLRRMSEDDY